MNSKKRIIMLALSMIAISAILCVLYVKNANHDLSRQLYKNGVNIIGVENFKISDASDDSILAERDGEIIKIKIIPEETKKLADNYINKEIALFQGIFEPHLPPYPEFLTKEASCAEKYKPIASESRYGKSFIVYAGDRLGYGVCADDLVKYRASLGYFYCENSNKAFKVEYFTDKGVSDKKLTDFNNSFVCR